MQKKLNLTFLDIAPVNSDIAVSVSSTLLMPKTMNRLDFNALLFDCLLNGV
jgi:hypothetical protein